MAADMDTQVDDFTTAIASTCKGLWDSIAGLLLAGLHPGPEAA